MRAWVLVALAACSPDIATGAYLCGPEQACPEGQVCNGADNTCVLPSTATAFACDPGTEAHEPDQDPAHGAPLGIVACVSQPLEITGCLANNDKDDWFAFSAQPGCPSQVLSVSVTSPVAFEPITVELFDQTGATKLAAASEMCSSIQAAPVDGETTQCITQMLVPGTAYTLHVTPTGTKTCGGGCAFNRYRMIVQATLH